MTTPIPKTPLSGLAPKLVSSSLLDAIQAQAAIEHVAKHKIPFIRFVVEKGMVNGRDVAILASEEFGVPLFDLSAMDAQSIPVNLVSEKLIRHHNALPLFKRGSRLYVAVSDPTNLSALDEFKFHSGLSTDAILVEEQKLAKCIDQVLQSQQDLSIGNIDDVDLDELDISSGEELEDTAGGTDTDDAPIVRYVHKILLDAINSDASDIHFEPYEQTYRIRFRQDGILSEIATPPANLAARLAARLKVMSRLDISERRMPQDGRFKLKLSKKRAIDFRVSSCPTLYGEKIVLRILDSSVARLNIDALGMEERQRDVFLKAIHQPQGMVLVTGPTGSGKTVTLYTALNILNTPDCNISTVEDPVEINLPGINQVNVNLKAGLQFSTALRSFLRQDPDIVMVGEIRDLETAEIAVKAAQTGHMVLSTLHTNSAAETLTRLVNMGVAAYNIAASVTIIIAQRLSRKLCEHCKVAEDVPRAALLDMGFSEEQAKQNLTLYKAKGCERCKNGYKGRAGIYEVLPISENMGRLIMEHRNSMEVADAARKEGMTTLRESGLLKVTRGVISLEELNRVIKE